MIFSFSMSIPSPTPTLSLCIKHQYPLGCNRKKQNRRPWQMNKLWRPINHKNVLNEDQQSYILIFTNACFIFFIVLINSLKPMLFIKELEIFCGPHSRYRRWLIFHWVHVALFHYPFICWETPRFIPFPSSCKEAGMNMNKQVFPW